MARDKRAVERIYAILNSLNVHRHYAFRRIIFSDTLLVYNSVKPRNRTEHNYLVWYLIEFAEDLHHRLTGLDLFFRGVLVFGDFNHHYLKNLECYYGSSLIEAYNIEKKIPSIGLFIDSKCNQYNQYFKTTPFNEKFHFVYLNRDLERLQVLSEGKLPVPPELMYDQFPFLIKQVRFLQDINNIMKSHNDKKIRTKHLTAWNYYHKRYPDLLDALENSSFDIKVISPGFNWRKKLKDVEKEISYYKKVKMEPIPFL